MQKNGTAVIINYSIPLKGVVFLNQKIFNDAIAEIAHFMYNVGITEKPEISFFEDDNGVFERLFTEHITDENVLALKAVSEDLYLRILGMHGFGAGAYTAAKQLESGKSVSDFTEEEIDGIFLDFDKRDAFELALEKMGIALDSGNRQMLDRVIVIGMKETKLIAKENAAEPENIKAFMQVLFNAGISVYKSVKKV